MPAGHKVTGGTGAICNYTDDHGAYVAICLAHLHGEIGHIGDAGNTGHCQNTAVNIIIDTG